MVQSARLIWAWAIALGSFPASTILGAPCRELAGKTNGNARVLEVQEVSGTLMLSHMFGGRVELTGPLCRVLGQSRPTPNSNIRFEVWLPAPEAWNGRYQGLGNGGNGGTMWLPTMKNAIDGGYAVSG